MRVLLDTCVISEIRHPKGNPKVKAAARAFQGKESFLSAITIGELTKGIFALRTSRKKLELSDWLQNIEAMFADRVLPVTRETATIWGELTVRARRQGHTIDTSDGLIAATALQIGLHVMTRNVSDFAPTGVMILNPWKE
ncbi:MAG: type II toxin-antitoxin system VapC family toxin [Verrucomicrobiota bacterium]